MRDRDFVESPLPVLRDKVRQSLASSRTSLDQPSNLVFSAVSILTFSLVALRCYGWRLVPSPAASDTQDARRATGARLPSQNATVSGFGRAVVVAGFLSGVAHGFFTPAPFFLGLGITKDPTSFPEHFPWSSSHWNPPEADGEIASKPFFFLSDMADSGGGFRRDVSNNAGALLLDKDGCP